MAVELEDFCNTIQQDLNNLAGDNYGAMKREPTGLLSAVTSPQNRAGFNQQYITDGGDGKKKQVLIEWIQPIPVADTATSLQDVCAGGTEEATLRDVVELTGFASSRVMKFTDSELRKLCKAPSEHKAMIVAAHMSGLFRKVNQILVTKYDAANGGFIGGVAEGKELELLHYDGVTEAAKPDGEVLLMEDMADLGVTGRPIVVGSGIVSRYAKLANIGCCNDYGQDVSRLSGSWDFFRDRDVDIVLAGSENILAFAPGAVQMATYNQYRGEFRRVHEHFLMQTIVDPVTGIEIDMKAVFNECDELWRMAYFLHFDLFALPLTMFKDTDERDGVNYAFRYAGVRTEAAT